MFRNKAIGSPCSWSLQRVDILLHKDGKISHEWPLSKHESQPANNDLTTTPAFALITQKKGLFLDVYSACVMKAFDVGMHCSKPASVAMLVNTKPVHTFC